MPEDLKCPNCGMVYPWQVPRVSCRYCKTEFLRGTCYVCRQYSEHIRHGKCQACTTAINGTRLGYMRLQATADYKDWIKMITSLPKPVKPLTEDEWIKACSYFKDCAYCGAQQIEARVLFIPGYKGGMYSKFNVVPCCEKCATSIKNSNKAKSTPFSVDRMEPWRLKKITDYLEEQFNEYRKDNGL